MLMVMTIGGDYDIDDHDDDVYDDEYIQ